MYLFMAALALVNLCFDLGRESVGKNRSMLLIKVLRGEIELGLQPKRRTDADSEKTERSATDSNLVRD